MRSAPVSARPFDLIQLVKEMPQSFFAAHNRRGGRDEINLAAIVPLEHNNSVIICLGFFKNMERSVREAVGIRGETADGAFMIGKSRSVREERVRRRILGQSAPCR